MYEDLIDKKIKCVWKDGDTSKAVYGFVKAIDDIFLTMLTDKDNSILRIAINTIITIKVVE